MSTVKMSLPASPARTGVWVGIAAITMSFAAYTSALVVRQGSGGDWQHFHLPPLLYLNTLVLLASSLALEVGRSRVRWSWVRMASEAGSARKAVPDGTGYLALTFGLGLLFVAGQVAAWRDLAAQGLFLATNPSASFFYVLTALHALHLLGGIIAMGYVIVRIRRLAGEPPESALSAAALYWHFMDVLWLYLLLVLALRL